MNNETNNIDQANNLATVFIIVLPLLVLLAVWQVNIDNPRNMLSDDGKAMLDKVSELIKNLRK